jgi:aspartyl-tRNA(Asn)/glutamyl-tRNA(Gln) amidotransferase subunit A
VPPAVTAFRTAADVISGARSAAENVREALARLDHLQPRLNACISILHVQAIERARTVDAQRAQGNKLGSLAGVPIAVKDNLCTSIGKTTCASNILADFHSGYDAHVVEALVAAGAVIVAKTNLDEFAMGSSTENSAFGPTTNPWDGARVAGGTSGGSAAAVAARAVPAALGSDTGGSIRLPAALCGVVGLKPSYGRVSRYGLVAHGSSLDQVGPLTTTVEDAALLLGIIAGHDCRDSTCMNAPVPDYLAALNRSVKGVRIGISAEYFGEGLDPEVRAAVENAIALLEAQGAELVDIHLPHMKYGIACYYLISTAEASSNLARFDGVHYGFRAAKPADITELYSATRGQALGPEVKRRIMLGTYALSSGYYEAYYLKALKVRTLIKRDFDDAFKKVDVIASPVAPTTAFRIGEKSQDPLAMYLADIYTIAANLAGICAISVPCGFDSRNLPVGVQFMGPALGEETILSLAHQYQMQTDHHRRVPAIASNV